MGPYSSNKDGIIIPQDTYTAAPESDLVMKGFDNHVGNGLVVILDIEAVGGSQSVQLVVEGLDPASKKWYTILASAVKSTAAMTVLRVGPFMTASANLIAQDFLPMRWRVRPVHFNTTDTIQYSVGYHVARS